MTFVIPPSRGLLLVSAPLLAAAPFAAALVASGCGDDLCEDAQVVCDAAEANLSFERDCPDEPTECLASCIVDANDCSEDALSRCGEVCTPFVAEE